MTPRNTVIIILGPTGVGKTGLSVLLAKNLNTEIISADSMQVYRHMDIGTAKPSHRELKTVKHHLISILSPDEFFSAGTFRKMAVKIIKDLHSVNKIPIITGGTGLYIKTLTSGLFEGPEADWSLREELLKKQKDFGKEYLYERLKKMDSGAADRINPNDTRRIIRAIEILLSGSSCTAESKKTISGLQYLSTASEKFDFIKIGLLRDRKELYGLIERRVDVMMEKGLLRETEELLKMKPHKIPLQALGYKEIQLYLGSMISLEEAVRLLKKRTKMYAKRQFTWFRKEPDINWVDITGLTDDEEIFAKVIKDVRCLNNLMP